MIDRAPGCLPDPSIYELAVRYLDNQLTAEELSGFEAKLADDRGCRDALLAVCFQMAMITESPRGCIQSLLEDGAATFTDSNIPSAEETAERSHGEDSLDWRLSSPDPSTSSPWGFLSTTLPGTAGYLSSGWPVAYLIATVIFGLAMLIGSLIPVSGPQQIATQSSPLDRSAAQAKAEVVARITGMVDCRWMENPNFEIRNPKQIANQKSEIRNQKSPVSLGDEFALASGLMEITYDSGAKVILQGPVTYEVESAAGGFLSLGKLTAKLDKGLELRDKGSVTSDPQVRRPKPEDPRPESDIPHPSSLIPHPLFVVRTPTATVTDLGTEFGVEVAKSGETTSHVFRGSVRVQAVAADGQTQDDGRILRENESVRVESGAECKIVVVRTLNPSLFVREIPERPIKLFDLADVVAGGDGFSGRRNAGIDPTGRATATPSRTPRSAKDFLVGDGKYHRVETLPFVDGVFIPDGRRGSVQVDSAGHTFDVFAETSNELPGYLWACGATRTKPAYPGQSVLGGVDYASPGHGFIFLHANNGVTFALDAIRRANPGYRLLRFRATTGNTEMVSELGEAVYADVWVLVDGQSRFQRRQITRLNGAFSVAFPIHDEDRFLTLASTDGGNGVNADWIIFGDPRIELFSTGTKQGPNVQPQ